MPLARACVLSLAINKCLSIDTFVATRACVRIEPDRKSKSHDVTLVATRACVRGEPGGDTMSPPRFLRCHSRVRAY